MRWLPLLPLLAALACLAGCGTITAAPKLSIRGQLSAPTVAVLPVGTLAVVELRDETSDLVLTEQRQALTGPAAPWHFEMDIERAKLSPGHRLSVRGALLAQGWAQWLSEPVMIDASAGTLELGTLRLAVAQRPLAFQSVIRCGEKIFRVGLAGDTMRLIDGTQVFDLADAPSASGERLQAVDDPSTSVWSEGERVAVSVRGQAYADCVLLKPPASDKLSR